MLPFDNLVNIAQAFIRSAQPDPSQWNDAAAQTFACELQKIDAELQSLQRLVLTIDLVEFAVGL